MSEVEVEVFRLILEQGKYYETAEASRRSEGYGPMRYFTTNPVRYVGKFLYHVRSGYGDGSKVWAYFEEDDGNKSEVEYSYEGNTCFIEVSKDDCNKDICNKDICKKEKSE